MRCARFIAARIVLIPAAPAPATSAFPPTAISPHAIASSEIQTVRWVRCAKASIATVRTNGPRPDTFIIRSRAARVGRAICAVADVITKSWRAAAIRATTFAAGCTSVSACTDVGASSVPTISAMRVPDADVCIAGGGPAGSILALRLARLGHSVVVIERSAFDRPRIGESLSRGVWPLFDVLGILPEILRAGFLPIDRAVMRWESDAIVERMQPPSLAVDRPRFDALLLDLARRAGAVVMQRTEYPRPAQRGEGGRRLIFQAVRF